MTDNLYEISAAPFRNHGRENAAEKASRLAADLASMGFSVRKTITGTSATVEAEDLFFDYIVTDDVPDTLAVIDVTDEQRTLLPVTSAGDVRAIKSKKEP